MTDDRMRLLQEKRRRLADEGRRRVHAGAMPFDSRLASTAELGEIGELVRKEFLCPEVVGIDPNDALPRLEELLGPDTGAEIVFGAPLGIACSARGLAPRVRAALEVYVRLAKRPGRGHSIATLVEGLVVELRTFSGVVVAVSTVTARSVDWLEVVLDGELGRRPGLTPNDR